MVPALDPAGGTLPRLGVFLAYWPWVTHEEQLELARIADAGGLDALWVAEAWGQEAVATLGWLAAQTTRIGLGSAIMQIPARKPATTAMAAATLQMLSGGRFRLGLGVSGPQVSEGWYEEPFDRPVARTRAYVDAVARALAGGTIRPEPSPGDQPGHPALRLLIPPLDPAPIYLGSLGPKAIDQCFEIADGWLPFVVGTEMLSERPRPDRPFDISPLVPLAIADDVDAARDAVRPWLAFYFGAMGTTKKHFLIELAERQGFGNSAREVQRRYLAGDRAGAGAALDDALIDATAIATTPGHLAARLADLADAGADTVVAVPLGDRARAVTALVQPGGVG